MYQAEAKQAGRVIGREVVWRITCDALGGTFVLHGTPQVADMSWLYSAGVQLGLDDELAACDGMRVVGNAVDTAVAEKDRLGAALDDIRPLSAAS